MASIKPVTTMMENIMSEMNRAMKWRRTLQILTTTLLSLLLPLSFLLLARLSTADYLLSLNDHFPAADQPQPPPSLLFFSLLLSSIPLSPLHLLVSLVCVASLVHTLNNGRVAISVSPAAATVKPRLYTAWIVLCTLQVCVGLGIEGSIGAGIDASGFGGHERNLICRVVFFLGLYATTGYWWRTIVKPVVDDTVFGCEVEEGWVERVVMGMSLGGLWWWRLRDEVESLVVVAEMKRGVEAGGGVGVVDLMGWWLYYLVVTIGMVRVLKGLICFGFILLYRKVEQRQVVRDENIDSLLTPEQKV